MMTKMTVFAIIVSMEAFADSDSVTLDGYTWQYDIGKGDPKTAYITGVSPKKGDIVIPSIFPNRPVSNNGGYVYYYDLVVSTIRQLGGDEIISVSIPNSVNLIYSGALTGCEALRSISFPSWLDVKDFAKYQMITNITINVGSSNINSYAFSNCYKLLNLSIPEGITNIGESAFASCHRISTISLPVSLQSIAQNAFVHCYSLTNVTFLGDAPACEDGIFENANRDLVIYVPVGSKGWDGNPESTVLPKYWPYNTEGGRRIVHIGETVNDEPLVVTNYVYSTVTNYVFSTVTNEVFHYTTVTNVVKYVPEPGASPDAGYGINVGVGGDTVIAGAAGWDAFGVPNGMEWNKETGTLSGRAKLSGTYDLILVSGSGTGTKIMRTTITVAPYDTIVGYVGVAFSQSGDPLNNLKSYKTLPAGLKWANGKLSGVPTKKQTVRLATKDGEPVTIEIRALPSSVVGTFRGAVTDIVEEAAALPEVDNNDDEPAPGEDGPLDRVPVTKGCVTLSVTSAGKISGKIYEGGRTWTLSAANFSATSIPTNGEFRVSGTATRTVSKKTYKQKWSLLIKVGGEYILPGATVATGTFGDSLVFEAQRNFWKDAGAGTLIADWVGEYAWVAPDGGKMTLVLNSAGTVKVAGKLVNGRTLSFSVPLAYKDDTREVLLYAAPQTVTVKSGKKSVTKKYPEFIAVVKLVNEPGMSEAGDDAAYRYR